MQLAYFIINTFLWILLSSLLSVTLYISFSVSVCLFILVAGSLLYIIVVGKLLALIV